MDSGCDDSELDAGYFSRGTSSVYHQEYGALIGRSSSNKGRNISSVGDNKLVGLGPASMRNGDEAWLLAGARTPFIFRRGWGML